MEAVSPASSHLFSVHQPALFAPAFSRPEARSSLSKAPLGSRLLLHKLTSWRDLGGVVCFARAGTLKGQAADRSFDEYEDAHTRREIMLHSMQLAMFGDVLAGSGPDATTIVNSILGGYGLPKLKASAGYRLHDEFDQDFVFEYPRSWVGRRNSQRPGVIYSNYDTADKASVEVFPLPEDGDLVQEVVRRAVLPGGSASGDARLDLPPHRRIKTEKKMVGDAEYTYISFPSETITRSGYQVRRKNWAVATCARGQVYALIASARSDQMADDKEATLQHIVDTFRVR